MARKTMKQRLEALEETASVAVDYVAYANYAHRIRAAKRAIKLSFETGRYIDPESLEVD